MKYLMWKYLLLVPRAQKGNQSPTWTLRRKFLPERILIYKNRVGNRGTRSWSALPRVTQQVAGKAWNAIKVSWLSPHLETLLHDVSKKKKKALQSNYWKTSKETQDKAKRSSPHQILQRDRHGLLLSLLYFPFTCTTGVAVPPPIKVRPSSFPTEGKNILTRWQDPRSVPSLFWHTGKQTEGGLQRKERGKKQHK